MQDAAPSFVVLFFIPFSYSVITGVVIGYVIYLTIGLFTGKLYENFVNILCDYFPFFNKFFPVNPHNNSFDDDNKSIESSSTGVTKSSNISVKFRNNRKLGEILGAPRSHSSASVEEGNY